MDASSGALIFSADGSAPHPVFTLKGRTVLRLRTARGRVMASSSVLCARVWAMTTPRSSRSRSNRLCVRIAPLRRRDNATSKPTIVTTTPVKIAAKAVTLSDAIATARVSYVLISCPSLNQYSDFSTLRPVYEILVAIAKSLQ
jgi:hypothetical protein